LICCKACCEVVKCQYLFGYAALLHTLWMFDLIEAHYHIGR